MKLIIIDDGEDKVNMMLIGKLSFREYMDKLLHSDDVEVMQIEESVKC